MSPQRLPDRPASGDRSEPADMHEWMRKLERLLDECASEASVVRRIAQELDEAETWLDRPAE